MNMPRPSDLRTIICPYEDPDLNCTEEHNPLPGYENHHYGCDCWGCMRWYQKLKN
jgi:hypothetical protein